MSEQHESFSPENEVVYNFDEMCAETDYPVREICEYIRTIIEPKIENRQRLADARLGAEEIIKDVETHGDESSPRLVIVRQELGGVAIETVDRRKNQSEHNGFGRLILDKLFGEDYSLTAEGDVYKGYLLIRHDEAN